MNFDWNELAFASRKKFRHYEEGTFIAAPREMSEKRVKQLVQEYLPKGHIILGISKEPYVDGFEDQPQFRMLTLKTVQKVVKQVNQSPLPYKIAILNYFQRDLPYILGTSNFKEVLLVNGSWKRMFHHSESYLQLIKKGARFKMISPFSDLQEAHDYELNINKEFIEKNPFKKNTFTDTEMLEWAQNVSKFSFDYSYQTGAALGKRLTTNKTRRFEVIALSFNKVVPYQSYILHYGSLREKHYSPAQDDTYYDAVHAEVELMISAQRRKLDLNGTTLFINLMPCPSCSRMLADTDIDEVVYSIDHSDGYAIKMLESAGKKVRRVVP